MSILIKVQLQNNVNILRNYMSNRLKKLNQIYLYIFVILLFTIIINNFFLNTFILIKNNYEKRMINVYGYCDKQGYGFLSDVKKIINIEEGVLIKNSSTDFPYSGWMINQFYPESNPKFIVYLNKKKPLISDQIVFSNENCYLVTNDRN